MTRLMPCARNRQKPKAIVLPELVGLILALIVLVAATLVISKFGPFLYGGGKAQTVTDSFNSLSAELTRMASGSDPFTAVESFPYTLGDKKYSLIGFDAGDSAAAVGVGCLGTRNKPMECGSKACVCLFDEKMKSPPGDDAQGQTEGLVMCKKIDSVATVSSTHNTERQVMLYARSDVGPSGDTPRPGGLNLGEERKSTLPLKGAAAELRRMDDLFIQRGSSSPRLGGEACKETFGPSVYSTYENGPLYLERTIIDGVGHLIISPASEATSKRMKELRVLIGITIPAVQAKIASGDLTGAILDSKAWLEKRPAGTPDVKAIDISAMTALQGKAFQKISELDPRYASALLEKLGISPPIIDKAERHAGLFAIRVYKTALETMQTATSTPELEDLKAMIVTEGLGLCERLKTYQPEINNDLLPYFQKAAETLKGTSSDAAFLAAKQAAAKDSPEAAKLLSDYVAANPANDKTREARYLLAGIYEKNEQMRDAVSTYQQVTMLHTPAEQTLPDGRRMSASDEIDRICVEKVAESDIYDICSQVRRGTTCPTPTLAVLPKEACAQDLIDEKRCLADPDLVFAFQKAQDLAKAAGKTLLVTSAYRTIEQQQAAYDLYQQNKGPKAALPSCTAPHVSGNAIDVQLKGEPMGGGGDADMSHPHRKLLESVMCQAGFTRWNQEYWHYEYGSKRALENPARHPEKCSAP